MRWTAPANHGSKVTRYSITTFLGNTVKARKIVGPITQVNVTGLTNGRRYSFHVAAFNAHGYGPARAGAATIGAPAAPSGVNARSVSAGMRVSWHAPLITNGSRIVGYVVTPHLGGTALTPRAYASPAVAATVAGLRVGQRYTFTVAAKNGYGVGAVSKQSKPFRVACVGRRMTSGQADINGAPTGTTFCLSGVHNWTLRPKSGDRLVGPATLDGHHSTQYAILAGRAKNVVVSELQIRNYTAANQQGAILVYVEDRSAASGWKLLNLSVHDNGTSAGGAGVNLGNNWQVLGGRYYNNRQEGIGGAGNNAVVDGAELDHNNFTNDSYTTPNVNCGFEAGGFKWVADNVTVRNSRVHDNACKGLWVDGNSKRMTITNNRVYNNWDEGIFIEISSGAIITHNRVSKNGFHTNGNGCVWLWGGGITLSSSSNSVIANNTVTANCNGITGTQQNRPGMLQSDRIHNNFVAGPGGKTGAATDTGSNLADKNIVFANNTFSDGMRFCHITC